MILKPAKAATVSTSKFVLNIEGGTSRLRLKDKFMEGCHNIPQKCRFMEAGLGKNR